VTELKLPEINRVLVSGRLTRDPELRYAADGTHVTSFTLAFHRRYRAKDGSFGEQTGFTPVVTYQRLAEVCGRYLRKGSAVLVEGRLQMREWTGAQGRKLQRLEIRGDQVHFLEKAPASDGAPDAGTEEQQQST
jgi:single-strand DNA-binding protein